MDVDIRRLAGKACTGLMHHNSRMRQCKSLALGATAEQQCPHAGGLADADGADISVYELHGVVN